MIDIGKACFPECDSFRKPLPAAGNMAVTQHNPTPHAETLCITLPTFIARWGCRGIIPLLRGLGAKSPQRLPCPRSALVYLLGV